MLGRGGGKLRARGSGCATRGKLDASVACAGAPDMCAGLLRRVSIMRARLSLLLRAHWLQIPGIIPADVALHDLHEPVALSP